MDPDEEPAKIRPFIPFPLADTTLPGGGNGCCSRATTRRFLNSTMKPNVKEALQALREHLVWGDALVTKPKPELYSKMEYLSREILKQAPVRHPVFRGFRDTGYSMKEILEDKPVKLSERSGRGKTAESWSADPRKAWMFARGEGLGILLKAKPLPKHQILELDGRTVAVLKALAEKFDMPSIAATLKSFGGESELIVRTSNRKYTLCKNIVVLAVERDVYRDHLREFAERLGNVVPDDGKLLHFACGKGNLVFMPASKVDSWLGRLS